VHPTWDACRTAIGDDRTWYGFSREGATRYDRVTYGPDDVLAFGCESSGLPPELREWFGDRLLSLPMREGNRSLNLSNAVAVAAFEAWRQQDFE
jgi:tRNA (cytidine/uridine-2'-O-)-methyltransferase